MENTKLHRRGFTLVELLVVIVIIASLAAIALVMTGQVKRKSAEARNMSNMRNIAVGMLSKVSDEGRFFHRSADPRWDRWILPSLGYTPDLPTNRDSLGTGNAAGLSGLAEIFKAPDDKTVPEDGAYKCSYGVGAWLSNANGYPFGQDTKNQGVRIARISKPESWFMLIQNYKENNLLGKGFNAYSAPQHGVEVPSDKMIVVFVDGHAEQFPKSLSWQDFRKKHEPGRGD